MARSSGSSAGVFVTGLTVAALAVIGFFAFQANAAQERTAERKASASPSPSPSRSAPGATSLPPDSGRGERVVYSLGRERVWLVRADGKIKKTFRVEPGSVDPRPGVYRVQSRASHVTGTDGVPVENVVRFATEGTTTIGFSAALDGTMQQAESSQETGGIREHRRDGEAMWLFAGIGVRVVVVG